jgi:hypothetical protein
MEQRAGDLETEVMQLQRCLQMAQSQEGIDSRIFFWAPLSIPNEGLWHYQEWCSNRKVESLLYIIKYLIFI